MSKHQTLKLTYLVKVERRAPIVDIHGDGGYSRAIDEVLRGSGILNGQQGIQPQSIRFAIEES